MSRLGAAVAACAVAGAAFAQPVKDINIALIIPLSGPVMVNVTPAVNSIKMALEEVNAKGIMVGGQKYRFNVQWFDEECKPPVAINATRAALAQVQPLHMVWAGMCSSSAVATAPILLERKAVVLNAVSGTSAFAGPAGNPYLFKIKEDFRWRSRDLAAYLAKRGLKKGAIIAVNSDWGHESQKTFQQFAEKNGIRIVETLSYDEHTEEFVPLLAQVRRADPDFIFQASQLLDEQVAFLRAYKQLGLKIQLAGESTWTEDVPEKAGWSAIDGMLTASAWVPASPRPAVQAYLEKYRKAHGATPGFNGPPSYDMVYIAKRAFEKAGTLDSEAVRKVLRETVFEGMVYGSGKVNFNDRGQAEFPVSVTVFDADKKMRVLAPGSE
ncbi:MAG TPA: ABC transporter substrate-binding protein [Burkholderiales bacterium]